MINVKTQQGSHLQAKEKGLEQILPMALRENQLANTLISKHPASKYCEKINVHATVNFVLAALAN